MRRSLITGIAAVLLVIPAASLPGIAQDAAAPARPERQPSKATILSRLTAAAERPWRGFSLAQSAAVREELQLTPDQVGKLDAWYADFFQRVTEMAPQRGAEPSEEQIAVIRGFLDDSRQSLEQLLTESQRSRLLGIDLQLRGPSALNEAAIADQLSLTTDQRERLNALATRYREALKAGPQIIAGFNPDPVANSKAAESNTKAFAARARAKVVFEVCSLAVLTPDQRKAIERIQGAEFDGSRLGGSSGPRGIDRGYVVAIDEAGNVVQGAQLMLHTSQHGYVSWADQETPHVTLDSFKRADAIDVVARAPGYATSFVRLTGAPLASALVRGFVITLRKSPTATLVFRTPDGFDLPADCVPQTYFPEFAPRVQTMWQEVNLKRGLPDFNFLNTAPAGPSQFSFCVPEQSFHVAIYQPGYLRYFHVGPFTKEDIRDGKLVVDIPKAGTFTATFQPDDNSREVQSAGLDVMRRLGTSGSVLTAADSKDLHTTPLKVTDLAPGSYLVWFSTTAKPETPPFPDTMVTPGRYRESRLVTLEAGQTINSEWRVTPYDPDAFRGNETATLKFIDPDGSPGGGRSLKVTYHDGHYGELAVYSGVVPESGTVQLERISDRFDSSTPFGPYTVTLGSDRVGFFRIQPGGPREFEFRMVPNVGNPAPDATFIDLKNGGSIQLAKLKGKVVVLEFWATWCGPCQEPMAKINRLATEKSDDWKDRVAVITASTDEEREKVVPHMENAGWTAVVPWWVGETGPLDTSGAANRRFAINAVPTLIVIDREGVIRYRGHPSQCDLSSFIALLLK